VIPGSPASDETTPPPVRVLGSVGIEHPDGAPEPIGSVRLRRALAVLTINVGSVVSVDRLTDLLWIDNHPAHPDAALHTVVSRLRTRLGAAGLTGRIRTKAPGYVLQLGRWECDATRFTDLVDRAVASIDDDPAGAVERLDAAQRLWRGTPYGEFCDEEFAAADVARLTEYRALAAESRTAAVLALGRPAEAITLAEQAIAMSPLRERPRAQLMTALYRAGRQPEALAAFHDFRRLLDEELALSPSTALQDLQARILRADSTLAGRPTPDGRAAETRRLGNLPPMLTSLIGRDGAVSDVIELLRTRRVVTITGPGGVGKTKLALAAANAPGVSDSYPEGVWLVELAPLRTAATVADAITTTLKVSPAAGRSTVDRLLDYLGTQTALVVLDNCEHLADGVARLAKLIVEWCPGMTLLTTSQVSLNIDYESVYPLGPLELRDPTAAGFPAASRLFVDRAARVVPGYTPGIPELASIAELCRRLDGVPLAIELAAARMRVMTPQEILRRLPDRFRLLRTTDRTAAERHGTLRAVVEWSYSLLDSAEQQLFDRLSVFRGAFGVTDAAAVAGWPEPDAIDGLDTLVQRSMLQAGAGTDAVAFTMLETMRAFGEHRLIESGDERATRYRHARNVLDLVHRGQAAVHGADSGGWVRSVNTRFDDLRAAHAWAVENDLDLDLRLLAGLVDWIEFQVSAELIGWAEQAARRSIDAGFDDPEHRRLTATALALAGAGERFGGDLGRALALVTEAVDLIDDPTDPVLRFPLYTQAEISLYQGRLDDSRSLSRRVQPLAEQAGDVLRARWCEMTRLLALGYDGQVDEAVAGAQQLVDQDWPGITGAWCRYTLAEVLMSRDPVRAGDVMEQVVRDARRLADRFLTGVALLSAASLRARHGDPIGAVPLFREVLEHWHRMGNWTQRWTTFRTIADVLAQLDDPEPAALLLGATLAESRQAPVFGADAERLRDLQDRLRRRLGEQQLVQLLGRGADMPDGAVFQLARSALGRP
jgi:predicted ATPase/DNA-binding SARP family transcriptional activator